MVICIRNWYVYVISDMMNMMMMEWKYLDVPGTSVTSEETFSAASNIIQVKRMNLMLRPCNTMG